MSSGAYTKATLAEHFAEPGAPVACTIEKGGMTERLHDFREAFAKLVSSRRTPQGFRWVFRDEPGFEAALRDLAAREHTCCVFLSFVIAREDGAISCGRSKAALRQPRPSTSSMLFRRRSTKTPRPSSATQKRRACRL